MCCSSKSTRKVHGRRLDQSRDKWQVHKCARWEHLLHLLFFGHIRNTAKLTSGVKRGNAARAYLVVLFVHTFQWLNIGHHMRLLRFVHVYHIDVPSKACVSMTPFKSRYLQRSQYVTSIHSKNLEGASRKTGTPAMIQSRPARPGATWWKPIDLCAEFRAVGQAETRCAETWFPQRACFALAGDIVPISKNCEWYLIPPGYEWPQGYFRNVLWTVVYRAPVQNWITNEWTSHKPKTTQKKKDVTRQWYKPNIPAPNPKINQIISDINLTRVPLSSLKTSPTFVT